MPRSSIPIEIGWLAFFFATFVALVYAINIFVVPHHFNDKVAIAVAGLAAGLAMITARAWWQKRSQRS